MFVMHTIWHEFNHNKENTRFNSAHAQVVVPCWKSKPMYMCVESNAHYTLELILFDAAFSLLNV